ncbi:hypothetical protein GCK72_013262 [Caenorhabditis remanei]|uniref:Uncharacterized protein n=1 Tax=Caenorhabditis remanei TaxID=31234 RepID=A0A6A5GN47_CAERE|nr:hypothetical protein GCK72_013262 [Caenorhabditis remanei]KAF1756808.1 hypothetical protein GCK72_013262 [Caenorhabditis remanei]
MMNTLMEATSPKKMAKRKVNGRAKIETRRITDKDAYLLLSLSLLLTSLPPARLLFLLLHWLIISGGDGSLLNIGNISSGSLLLSPGEPVLLWLRLFWSDDGGLSLGGDSVWRGDGGVGEWDLLLGLGVLFGGHDLKLSWLENRRCIEDKDSVGFRRDYAYKKINEYRG